MWPKVSNIQSSSSSSNSTSSSNSSMMNLNKNFLKILLNFVIYYWCLLLLLSSASSSSSSSSSYSSSSLTSSTNRIRPQQNYNYNYHQLRPYPTRSIGTQTSNQTSSPPSSSSSSSSGSSGSLLSSWFSSGSSSSGSSGSSGSTSPIHPPTNVKAHGSVNCILAIFNDISWCNQTYHQSLTHLIVKGYRKESRVYRRQFCCGYWSRERCIFNAAQKKCHKDTYDKLLISDQQIINNSNSPKQQQQRFFSTNINCDDYENNSPICSAISRGNFKLKQWMLIIFLSFFLIKIF